MPRRTAQESWHRPQPRNRVVDREVAGYMKLYLAIAVFTTIYAIALTLGVTTAPEPLLWNGVVGFMLSLSLVLAVIPLAGPLLYDTATQVMRSALNPPIDLDPALQILRPVTWILNILFTTALILYILQIKRRIARRIIKVLLF